MVKQQCDKSGRGKRERKSKKKKRTERERREKNRGNGDIFREWEREKIDTRKSGSRGKWERERKLSSNWLEELGENQGLGNKDKKEKQRNRGTIIIGWKT